MLRLLSYTLKTQNFSKNHIAGSSILTIHQRFMKSLLSQQEKEADREEINSFSPLYTELAKCKSPKEVVEAQAKIDHHLQERVAHFIDFYKKSEPLDWQRRMHELNITLKQFQDYGLNLAKVELSASQAEAAAERIALQKLLSSNKKLLLADNPTQPLEPSFEHRSLPQKR